jgi:hypothetical protein
MILSSYHTDHLRLLRFREDLAGVEDPGGLADSGGAGVKVIAA